MIMSKPGQRDADRSRTAILASAEELFANLGFERVSLAEIAELAGVSRGLPSYFFLNKENLYRTVMEQAAARNRGTVLDVVRSMKGSGTRAILLTLIDRYIDYLAANPRIVRLLQWEALETATRHAPDAASGIPRRVFLEASQLISECVGAKRVKGLGTEDLLLSIVSMCLYPFQVRPADETRDKAFIQRHKRHISAIVVRAIGEDV
jgi:TetR/AcrR family transcriptional regulator